MTATTGFSWAPYAALAFGASVFGAWAIVSKVTIGTGAPPFVFIFYRGVVGTLTLVIAQAVFMPSAAPKKEANGRRGTLLDALKPNDASVPDVIPAGDMARLALLGLTQLGTVVGFVIASGYVSALMVSIFQPTIPVVTAVMSAICGIEEISVLKIASVFCAVIGAIIVATLGEKGQGARAGGAEDTATIVMGTALLLTSVLSTAVYLVLLKGVTKTYPPLWCTTVAYAGSALFILPVTLVKHGFDYAAWSLGGSHLAWMGVGYTSTLAAVWVLLAWANKKTSPTTVAASSTLQPCFAAVLQWAVFGVVLTMAQAIGGFIIIVGLLLYLKAQMNAAEAAALLEAQKNEASA